MPTNNIIDKENIDIYLNELAKELKNMEFNNQHVKLILVGGASILINYNFRKSTEDIDASSSSFEIITKVINNIAKNMDIDEKWMNDDFKKSPSFSKNIDNYSVLYKTLFDVLEIRTIKSEYLVAMKLRSGRLDKRDLSDVIGIIKEHKENNNSLNKNDIENAVINLYGSLNVLPKYSKKLLSNFSNVKDYGMFYNYMLRREDEARKQKKKLEKNSIKDMVFIDNDILLKKLDVIIEEKFKYSDNNYFGLNNLTKSNNKLLS